MPYLATMMDDDSALSLSSPIPYWLEEAGQEWLYDTFTSELVNNPRSDPNLPSAYPWTKNILLYKGHLVLLPTLALKHCILMEFHSSYLASRSRFQKTNARA